MYDDGLADPLRETSATKRTYARMSGLIWLNTVGAYSLVRRYKINGNRTVILAHS